MDAALQKPLIFTAFALMLCANIALWSTVRDIQPEWKNVPPVPSYNNAAFAALGDDQFAYRSNGILIQNLGDTGGRTEPLKDFNYTRLESWLNLGHQLDSRSNFLPFLAAFYFSGNQDKPELIHVVRYLEKAGQVVEPQKWRWLAQAALIARFKMDDLDLSLELARKLAAMNEPDMPSWAKAMPAYILNAQGEKQAAYDIMIGYLKEGEGKIHPNEVNATVAYICDQILSPADAAINPLCQKP